MLSKTMYTVYRNGRVKNLKVHIYLYLPLLLYVAFVAWWAGINFFNLPDRDNFADSYSVVALIGGIAGLVAASKWGLLKSKFGAAMSYLSIGLLVQFLGLLIYTLYYRIGGVELAFPSVGDIPLLLASVFYVLGVYNLLKVIVYNSSIFKPRIILVLSILATVGLLILLWFSFLNLGIQDDRGFIYSLLNVLYPLSQAFYFLLGLVAVMQARRMTGGKMLLPVSVMLSALIVLYAADFTFLYLDYNDLWEPAAWNDLLYLSGFGLMVLAMLLIDRTRLVTSSPSGAE